VRMRFGRAWLFKKCRGVLRIEIGAHPELAGGYRAA